MILTLDKRAQINPDKINQYSDCWCPSSLCHHVVSSHIELYKIQYIPRNMHTVFALLCFVVVVHWLIFPYPSGLLHWHCGNLTIAPVPAKQPWWIWINTSCEFIMNDCITTTKQSTTKPCAYFLGYTVCRYLSSIKQIFNCLTMTMKNIYCQSYTDKEINHTSIMTQHKWQH